MSNEQERNQNSQYIWNFGKFKSKNLTTKRPQHYNRRGGLGTNKVREVKNVMTWLSTREKYWRIIEDHFNSLKVIIGDHWSQKKFSVRTPQKNSKCLIFRILFLQIYRESVTDWLKDWQTRLIGASRIKNITFDKSLEKRWLTHRQYCLEEALFASEVSEDCMLNETRNQWLHS